MSFDPRPTKYPFPEKTDEHYITIKKNDGTVFDENYPYVDLSLWMRFRQFWVRVLLNVIVFPAARVRLGLRIHGRDRLKKHRELLANGAVSVSNHMHFWDYICVMRALRPSKPYVPVWAPNMRGENAALIRLVRGIPIPENDLHATRAFSEAVDGVLDGGWLHVYPEGSMWEFYRPIRPFKTGAAYIAIRNGKPIVPMAFSYRRPGWIRRKIFHQLALLDLNIGEVLFADASLPKHRQIEDLTARAHAAVCSLAGIEPQDKLYPAIFNDSRRVDYYTDKYGV